MRIVTAERMRRLEAEAARLGVPEPALMATAGAAVAEATLRLAPAGRIVVLVGAGNNGGDALVAAHHLLAAGRPVAIWTISGRRAPAPVPEETLANAQRLADLAALRAALTDASAVLDGLYGIGLNRPVAGEAAEAITAVNAAHRRPDGLLVLAIDIPSGLLADSGEVAGAAVEADVTLALGFPKIGLYNGRGADHAGRLEVLSIGLPKEITVTDGPQTISAAQVGALLPRRAATADKRDVGAVIVVGGALNYPGAPRLAGLGAMRAGAGYVTLAVPRSIFGIVAGSLLEATYIPLPEFEGSLGRDAAELLGKELGRYAALVLGCGLGREEGTGAFIERLLGVPSRRRGTIGFGRQAEAVPEPEPVLPEEIKLVIDADALTLLSEVEDWHERLQRQAVLTPNIREMAKLTGLQPEEIETRQTEVAREHAGRWGQVVVLKKGHTVVATPDGQVWVAEQAMPALATAGSGDVLSGVIGGLLAQGLEPWQAAISGVYLGQHAAEAGVREVGSVGLIAGDLPLLVARAIQDLTSAA
jgi:NAD(P)H-hydrate epimerase